ncbi:Cleavage and polyadenylation specificity factor subunit 1 [Nowakowskiella sp. JEL0407]|nr:Cleavage and polyadenylation specificity factor subunit 1 [Nowakowskiella sp. JEL0407]
MFAATQEVLRASGSELSVEAVFTGEPNLLVAKAAWLFVYALAEEDAPERSLSYADVPLSLLGEEEFPNLVPLIETSKKGPPPKIARLEILSSHKLHGVITSMTPVRTQSSVGLLGMDSLLLSFADAKMALVEYNRATNSIVTVSLHYYEREEFKKESISEFSPPEIRLDPQQRCAALHFYHDKLAILPFKQDTTTTNIDDLDAKEPFLPSHVVSFSSIDARIKNVVDFVFLYDYFEPTLAILYEKTQTWTGRLASRKDSKSLIVVSLDTTAKTFPVLFTCDNLPYNAFKLIPVPNPVRGILIVTPNALIHVDQTSIPGVCCAVNGYFGLEHNFPEDGKPKSGNNGAVFGGGDSVYAPIRVSDYKNMGVSLDGSVHAFLNPETILFVLRNGEFVVFRMLEAAVDDGKRIAKGWKRKRAGVGNFHVERVGVCAVEPTCCCALGLVPRVSLRMESGGDGDGEEDGYDDGVLGLINFGYLFIGSRTDYSMLVQYAEAEQDDDVEHIVTAEEVTSDSVLPDSTVDMDDEDADLYGEEQTMVITTTTKSVVKNEVVSNKVLTSTVFKYRLCDLLICSGPIGDMVITEINSVHTGKGDETASDNLRYRYQPSVPRRELELVSCIDGSNYGGVGISRKEIRPNILMSTVNEFTDVMDCWVVKCKLKNEESKGFDDFMILSRRRETTIFTLKDEVLKTERHQFHRDTPTVAVGSVLDETAIVQIHPDGILMVDSTGKRTFDVAFGDQDTTWAVSASINDPFILVLFNVGRALVYQVDSATRSLKKINEITGTPISAICLYCDDMSGSLFPTIAELQHSVNSSKPTTQRPQKKRAKKRRQKPASATPKKVKIADLDEADIEEQLYAGDDDEMEYEENEVVVEEEKEQVTEENVSKVRGVESMMYMEDGGFRDEKSFWCVLYRENGNLEILRVMDLSEGFCCENFRILPSLAVDVNSTTTPAPIVDMQSVPEINEILMVNLGRNDRNKDPYLMLRTDESDFLIYKVFQYVPSESLPDPIDNISHYETSKTRLAIRLQKQSQSHITRPKRTYSNSDDDKINAIPVQKTPSFLKRHYMREFKNISGGVLSFREYNRDGDELGSYSGVFVCGERPCWVMCGTGAQVGNLEAGEMQTPNLTVLNASAKGKVFEGVPVSGSRHVRVHPMNCDGEVMCFSAFSNVNCINGFVYFNKQGSLRISQLPNEFTYDHPFPFRKISFDKNPLQIKCHHSTRMFVASTYINIPFVLTRAQHSAAILAGVIEDGDKYMEAKEKENVPDGDDSDKNEAKEKETKDEANDKDKNDEGSGKLDFDNGGDELLVGMTENGTEIRKKPPIPEEVAGLYLPRTSEYKLELLSPVTWETIDQFELEEYEHIISVESVLLESKQTTSGQKEFLAVGTGIVRGEDLTCRGRILMFDIIEVVPEIDKPQTNHKFKLLFQNEEKGPITALADVNGYLIAAIGQKIIIHSFEDAESLVGVAFIDVNIFVKSIRTVKNMILVGDAYKSILFLGFQDEPAKLQLLGKDFHPMQVFDSEFLIHDNDMCLLVSDANKNCHLFTYAPYNVQSMSGQKLIKRGDFHLGSTISKFCRLRKQQSSQDYFNFYSTLDGSVGQISSLSEKMYKRIYSLYTRLITHITPLAGLDPRGYYYTTQDQSGLSGKMRTIEYEFVMKYLDCSVVLQNEIAKGIGAERGVLVDDLLEIQSWVEYI